MDASEPKCVNPVLNSIGVKSLRPPYVIWDHFVIIKHTLYLLGKIIRFHFYIVFVFFVYNIDSLTKRKLIRDFD